MAEKIQHKCPICGKFEFPERDSFEICPECGWEDDWYQLQHPDDDIGANGMSLNEYKAEYKKNGHPSWLDDD